MARIGRSFPANVIRFGIVAAPVQGGGTVTPSDTGMTFSDSLARVAIKPRTASDTGSTITESVAKAQPRAVTDRDEPHSCQV